MGNAQLSLEILNRLKLKKTRALFLYLIAMPGKRQRTERLVDLLWRSTDPLKGAASCRQAIRQIRVAAARWPELKIVSGAGVIHVLAPARWALQDDIIAQLQSRNWEPGHTELATQYLTALDLHSGISDSLDSWLTIAHTTMLSDMRRTLDVLLLEPLSPDTLVRAAQFALDLEPTNETAIRALMQHYWEHQKAIRSIELYNRLYDYLDGEFDQEPEGETIALLSQIKLDPEREKVAHKSRSAPSKVSLSIELQESPDSTRQQASLLSVLTSDFRNRLSRFREWTVQDHGQDTLFSIHVSLASIQQDTVYYIETRRAQNGEILWSDSIVNPTNSWDDKVRQSLVNIASALSIAVRDRTEKTPAAQGYDKWLRAQTLLDSWSPHNEVEALKLLSDVSLEMPKFAPAHAELAGALNVRHVLRPGTEQTEDIKQTALHHAIEAVSIDPLDTRAHRVLAWCYCHKKDFELAEFHFDQAMRLNPENLLTMASCALGFGFTHALETSGGLVRDVKRRPSAIDPFHSIYLAVADYLSGSYAEAARQCEGGAHVMSTVGGWHAAALFKLGHHEQARQRLQSWQQDISGQWFGNAPLTGERLIAWFVSVFPMRHEAVREDLRDTLLTVSRNLD